jgi:hypothetical protein
LRRWGLLRSRGARSSISTPSTEEASGTQPDQGADTRWCQPGGSHAGRGEHHESDADEKDYADLGSIVHAHTLHGFRTYVIVVTQATVAPRV